MKKKLLPALTLTLGFLAGSCGFLENARLTTAYIDHAIPHSAAANLVLWPVHLTGLTACAVIDQGIHSIEIIPHAGLDSYDYARNYAIATDGDNIILERTLFIPRLALTPFVGVGSYISRWLFPFGSDERIFRPESDR